MTTAEWYGLTEEELHWPRCGGHPWLSSVCPTTGNGGFVYSGKSAVECSQCKYCYFGDFRTDAVQQEIERMKGEHSA